MSELTRGLPNEVYEFAGECRRKVYPLDAQPNYKTGNDHEYGFRFERDGMVYLDISTEQNGIFSGEEYVAIVSPNPDLNGQKFYRCQYAGADEPYTQQVGQQLVARVQHGLVMERFGIVRFGNSTFSLPRFNAEGRDLLYYETSTKFSWGRVNFETLSYIHGPNNCQTPVYTASCQFAVLKIR